MPDIPLPELIYVGDPMCSWCWGFAPELDALIQTYATRLRFRVVLGGLRPGSRAQRMDDSLKGYIRHHWEAVEQASGQPFDYRFFEREQFLYDTDPPSRAVIAMRHIRPDSEYIYYRAVQSAFYAENIDVTDSKALGEIADAIQLDGNAVRDAMDTDEIRQATQDDYNTGRQLGIQGFPAVLLQSHSNRETIGRGYIGVDELKRRTEHWLRDLHARQTEIKS